MKIKHAISLDFQRNRTPSQIDVVQGDTYSRYVEITLYDNVAEWTAPEGVKAAIRFKKPDRTQGVYDTLPDGTAAYNIQSNIVTVGIAPQMLTARGKVTASVVLFLGNAQLATFPFVLNVVENPAAGQSISNDYYYLQTWDDVNAAIGNLADLETEDQSSLVAAINEIAQQNAENKGLTDEQVDAIHGMFKVCAYVDSTAVSAAYTAFREAFDLPLEEIPATGITLSASSLNFTDVASQTLIATLTPSGATDKVVWTTSNSSVATVSEGKVVPVADGSCTITATAGSVSATCSVTVEFAEEVVYYSVTNTLSNVTIDNSATSVVAGGSYLAVLSVSDGYTMSEVKVTMGSTDVTSTAYNSSTGAITISAVTGDIVITASAYMANQVAMLSPVSDVAANKFRWFDDAGETTNTSSMATRGSLGGVVASSKVFEADTTLKITLTQRTFQAYDFFGLGSTDWDGVSTPANNIYYLETVGTQQWVKKSGSVLYEGEYTVRAGFRLIVSSYATSIGSSSDIEVTVVEVSE